jgi:hypothetical protein
MSKKMIASEKVALWIGAGVSKEDCDLWYMIKDLKQALLDVAMLQVDIDEEEEEQIKTVQSISAAIVHALRNLNGLYEELEDEIVPTHWKGGETQ